mgnify:CR=1 FL=1
MNEFTARKAKAMLERLMKNRNLVFRPTYPTSDTRNLFRKYTMRMGAPLVYMLISTSPQFEVSPLQAKSTDGSYSRGAKTDHWLNMAPILPVEKSKTDQS